MKEKQEKISQKEIEEEICTINPDKNSLDRG